MIMQELKLGIKLLSFSFRAVLCLIGGILMFLLGVVLGLLVPQGVFVFGIFFIAVTPLWFVQLLLSLNVSEFVQTSPLKKILQVRLPVLFSFISATFSYLVIIALGEVSCLIYPSVTDGDIVGGRLFGAVMILLILCYCGVCYKYYMSATVIFFVCIEAVLMPASSGRLSFADCPLALGTLIGFVLILIGCLLQYGLFSLTYKKPLSKMAQYAGLRRRM